MAVLVQPPRFDWLTSPLFPVATLIRAHTGTRAAVTGAGTQGGTTCRTAHRSIVALTTVRLVYTNFYRSTDSSTVPTNQYFVEHPGASTFMAPIKVRGALEYPLNTIVAATFNGGDTSVVIPAGGFVVSDPITISVPVDTTFYARSFVQAFRYTTSGVWPTSQLTAAHTNAGEVTRTNPAEDDLTDTGASFVNAIAPYAPVAIVADSDSCGKSVLVVGDSISEGNGKPTSGLGWPEFAWTGISSFTTGSTGIPTHSGTVLACVLNMSCGNVRATEDTNLNNLRVRLELAKRMTHVVLALGTNDLQVATTKTAAELEAYLTAIADAFRAAKSTLQIGVCTIAPHTTTTDNYITTANQTVIASETDRTDTNDWIRTTPSPFDFYLDLADVWESSRNSGKWIVRSTTGNANGTTVVSNVADTSIFRVGQTVYANGTSRTVSSKTSTTVTFSGNVTTGSGISLIAVATTDGIHPEGGAQQFAAEYADTLLP